MALANLDHDFGHWLAGFAAGEGSFNIGMNGRGGRFCSFRIALHECRPQRGRKAWVA